MALDPLTSKIESEIDQLTRESPAVCKEGEEALAERGSEIVEPLIDAWQATTIRSRRSRAICLVVVALPLVGLSIVSFAAGKNTGSLAACIMTLAMIVPLAVVAGWATQMRYLRRRSHVIASIAVRIHDVRLMNILVDQLTIDLSPMASEEMVSPLLTSTVRRLGRLLMVVERADAVSISRGQAANLVERLADGLKPVARLNDVVVPEMRDGLIRVLSSLQPSDSGRLNGASIEILIRWLWRYAYADVLLVEEVDLSVAILHGLSSVGAAGLRPDAEKLAARSGETPNTIRIRQAAADALKRLDAWTDEMRTGAILLRGSESPAVSPDLLVRAAIDTGTDSGAVLMRAAEDVTSTPAYRAAEDELSVVVITPASTKG